MPWSWQLETSWDAVKLGEGGLLSNGGLTPLQIMDGYKGSAIQADKAL